MPRLHANLASHTRYVNIPLGPIEPAMALAVHANRLDRMLIRMAKTRESIAFGFQFLCYLRFARQTE